MEAGKPTAVVPVECGWIMWRQWKWKEMHGLSSLGRESTILKTCGK